MLHQQQEQQSQDLTREDVSTLSSSQLNPPPGFTRPGLANAITMSTLEMPLFKRSKRLVVRDDGLFPTGKSIVVGDWLVAQTVARGSLIIN